MPDLQTMIARLTLPQTNDAQQPSYVQTILVFAFAVLDQSLDTPSDDNALMIGIIGMTVLVQMAWSNEQSLLLYCDKQATVHSLWERGSCHASGKLCHCMSSLLVVSKSRCRRAHYGVDGGRGGGHDAPHQAPPIAPRHPISQETFACPTTYHRQTRRLICATTTYN